MTAPTSPPEELFHLSAGPLVLKKNAGERWTLSEGVGNSEFTFTNRLEFDLLFGLAPIDSSTLWRSSRVGKVELEWRDEGGAAWITIRHAETRVGIEFFSGDFNRLAETWGLIRDRVPYPLKRKRVVRGPGARQRGGFTKKR